MFRKNLLVVLFTCLSLFSLAQSPLEFNYQAVARDQKGIPLDKREIKVRFSIRSNAPDGNVEYMEIRELETNPFGMFTVSIGSTGAYFSSGSLSDVKWDNGKKFLQVEIDVKGGNDYKNLGATQMVSVPYALFALKTLDDKKSVSLKAGGGISIKDSVISIGNIKGDFSAALAEDRFIPLNGKKFLLSDGASEFSFSKDLISIQQDSALMSNESRNSGGVFLKVNPIFPRPDAVPFVFSRMATTQHNGTTSPNEVVMWGHNMGPGGGALISGLPAIGYSIESNFKPSPEDRWVESHEYYVTPQGNQIRLKSYTIRTGSNIIDFYHTSHNLYIKNPTKGDVYFDVSTDTSGSNQQLTVGIFHMDVNNIDKQVQLFPLQENSSLFIKNKWRYIFLPGLIMQNDGLLRLSGNMIPEVDNSSFLGDYATRFSSINAINYKGKKMMLKEDWAAYQNIQPTSTLDIEGINGFNQFRLRKTYTPTGSSDPNGNTGDMSWDDNYIYIKTSAGWKRTSLESF